MPRIAVLDDYQSVAAEFCDWSRVPGPVEVVEFSDHVGDEDALVERLSSFDVVVLRVDVVNTRYTDPAGHPVPETELVGTGSALIATGGSTMPATWTKASEGDRVQLTDVHGGPVLLAPGTTWVELVPTRTGSVTLG